MTEDIARSVVSISTNTVTLGAGGTSIGHGLYLIDSSVHVFRDVPLVGSSNSVRSNHTQSVLCILVMECEYFCEEIALCSCSSRNEDRINQNIGLGTCRSVLQFLFLLAAIQGPV